MTTAGATAATTARATAVTATSAATAALALGSNLGDRFAYLQGAVSLLDEACGVVAVSSVYETEPVGGPTQDDYLNAVVLVPAAAPRELLELARRCEARASRQRLVRWGPRTLDVDVIACGGMRSDDPEIILPHPRAHLRAFVCVPWLEVEPDAVVPGHGRLADLVARMRRDGGTDGLRETALDLRSSHSAAAQQIPGLTPHLTARPGEVGSLRREGDRREGDRREGDRREGDDGATDATA